MVFFLKATKNGLFDLHWDVLCPNCRGAKFQATSLRDMKKTAHCESCNIDYDADFDKSIEITFKPASIVREINDATFCIGGAGNTPHIIAQIRIPVGKTKINSFQTNPSLKKLLLSNPDSENEITVKVEIFNAKLKGFQNEIELVRLTL